MCALAVPLGAASGAGDAGAVCRTLSVQFQPVAYPASRDPRGVLEASGPQFAVWIADGQGRWLADLAVTRMTAIYGIGNRPGVWNFASSPKFPYGRRLHAMPVWAWSRKAARGADYPEIVMSRGQPETTFGFHESVSSNEPYYCRPLRMEETVDAVTCPTPRFTSCKGDFAPDGRRNPYPPRNDLTGFDASRDMPAARELATLNDVDAVATATPVPGAAAAPIVWSVPEDLAAGDYVIYVEVNKEYDQNASHRYQTQIDSMGLVNYGNPDNIGQPSIVWAVPVSLSTERQVALALDAAGYGPWDGQPPASYQVAGDLIKPVDASLSDEPGSGLGRLAVEVSPEGMYKVRVETDDCETGAGGAGGGGTTSICDRLQAPDDIADLAVAPGDVGADRVRVRFTQTGVRGDTADRPATSYEVKFRQGSTMNDPEFEAATPAGQVMPAARGTPVELEIKDLKPEIEYTVGVRATGPCRKTSRLSTATFTTTAIPFATVQGCFVATAAWGSPLQPQVGALRRFRDRFLEQDPVGRALVRLYYHTSPPLAGLLGRSELARAIARHALEPLVGLARAATEGR